MILLFLYIIVFLVDYFFSLSVIGIFKYILPFPLYFLVAVLSDKLLNVTLCDPNDYIMSWHGDNNICSVVGCSILDRVPEDFETLLSRMERKIASAKHFVRLRQTLHRGPLCGYWKMNPGFKFRNHYTISDEKVDSYEKLYGFMAHHLSSLRFPEGQPPWRIFFLTKFRASAEGAFKMAIIVKVHHSIADGISLMSGLLDLLECKEYETVKLPKITQLQKIFLYLPAIFKMPYNMMMWYRFSKDKNFFHTGEVSGSKKVFCSEPLGLDRIKKHARAHKATVNDLLTAILLKALEIYAPRANKGQSLEEVLMMVPFSLRPLPSAGQVYDLSNRVTGINVKFKLKSQEKLEFYTEQSADLLGKIRKSSDIFVVSVLTDFLISFFPRPLYEIVFRMGVNLPSCIFTNVPGPVKQVETFGNSRIERVFFFVNMLSDTAVFLTVISYNGFVIFSCSSDDSVPFEPKAFIDCVDEVAAKFLE